MTTTDARADVRYNRRVQLLIDEATYQRAADEAAREHRSVNSVLREAIAARYADDDADAQRAAAAGRLLERMRASSDEQPYDPADFDDDAYYENAWSRDMKQREADSSEAS